MTHEHWLHEAVRLARRAVVDGGGPFGALVVCEGVVIGSGGNRVVPDHDPTAHAEIVALRAAARHLQRHDLRGCILYASCEPCPMCRAAAHWARIDAIFYAAGRDQAAAAGFDDCLLHEAFAGRCLLDGDCRQIAVAQAAAPFDDWLSRAGRVPY